MIKLNFFPKKCFRIVCRKSVSLLSISKSSGKTPLATDKTVVLFTPAMFLLPRCYILLETVTSTHFIKPATVKRLSEKTCRDSIVCSWERWRCNNETY